MRASGIKAEFSNLDTHVGTFSQDKLKMKCDISYEEQMLIMDGGKTVARMHARNINNVHLEKKAIRIQAMNFEIREGKEVSVLSGSIRLELGDEAETWYKELWG